MFGRTHVRAAALAVTMALCACSQSSATSVVPSQALSPSLGFGAPSPAANGRSLLYVSDSGSDAVRWFDWPDPRQALGTISGLSEPQALCNDGTNVYVTNVGDSNVVVYRAGHTNPLRTLHDAGTPIDCSYDVSGKTLAVADVNSGDVALFGRGMGSPHYVSSSKLSNVYAVQYDGSGTLYILAANSSGGTVLAELRADSKHIQIECPQFDPWQSNFPGALAWDGTHLVTNDQSSGTVYRIEGCRSVGTTTLDGSSDIVGFDVSNGRLVGADAGNADVEIYAYPKGGNPTQTLSGFSEPIGVTIVNGAKGN